MSGGHQVEFKMVNGLLGDPAIYGFFPRAGEALLFDLGTIDKLSTRELLRVRVALVSHTHIDHFIGFDRLLRVNIPHGRTIEVCGPPGIIDNVRGKLGGYLWNLLEPDQIRYVVHQLDPKGVVRSVLLANQHGFTPIEIERPLPHSRVIDPPPPSAPVASMTTLSDGTRIEAVALDHGTPSIAYVCQSPCRFFVKEGALESLGLRPGPWIKELQSALADGEGEREIAADGRRFVARDLGAVLLEAKASKPIGYLTDLGFTRGNIERIRQLFYGAEHLICESNYRDQEVARAKKRMHLTTKQAALLAAYARVSRLSVFHISNIYVGAEQEAKAEALHYFSQFSPCCDATLEAEIAHELTRG